MNEPTEPLADAPTPAKTAATAKTAPSTGSDSDSGSFGGFGSEATLESLPERLAERAAIVQEGAVVPAEWAEGFARLEAL
ncbi:MAG: hypothetical protein ABI906_08460, partial [Pseudomonadota bacterium]